MEKKRFDQAKLLKVYMKSNYRLIGHIKHSAIKPCHWQEQKLLTGRENQNCYKGYFGIESETCIQNTPALPFCNHQCVFCWRDIENCSFGAEWKGMVDDPKMLVREMIRHSKNIIFEHITKTRALENFDLMHKILYFYLSQSQIQGSWRMQYSECEFANLLQVTRTKIHRALLLLKNCKILSNPDEEHYLLRDSIVPLLRTKADIDLLICKEVTTREEIEQVFHRAMHPKHAAISLAGEPTLYPRLGELVNEFRKNNICTFIVTNGTHPEVIRSLWEKQQLPTQLYVTLPAPNQEKYLRICRPLIPHGWDQILNTLSLLPQLPCRTVVRITAVNFLNLSLDYVDEYVQLLLTHPPNFIDLKAFTVEAHALELVNRLRSADSSHELHSYAPSFHDLRAFAEVLEQKTGFEIITTHEASKDILFRGSWPKERSIKIDFTRV